MVLKQYFRWDIHLLRSTYCDLLVQFHKEHNYGEIHVPVRD